MSATRLYYLRQYSNEEYKHGGVGYADAESIFSMMGARAIELPDGRGSRGLVSRLAGCLGYWLRLRKHDKLFFIFPVYGRLNRLLMRALALKSVKVICLVADVDGLKDNDDMLLKKEVHFLKHFNQFVVHNEPMSRWIKTFCPAAAIETLEFFDFLVPVPATQRTKTNQVVFAGNLAKSGFLEQLPELVNNGELEFHLYGPGFKLSRRSQHINYHGAFDPRELPALLHGSFGLVWDGDSIHGLTGPLGCYMAWISQHKLSLYILAGLPIIVPASSASAILVLKYQIGFTVGSLGEIPGKIKALPEESFQLMRSNMLPLAEKISSGACLRNALREPGD